MWSESIFTWSTPNAPHQRFWANGRSMLTVIMLTLGSLPASSLKRLVCASHTGVSSDGITLMMRTWLPVSFNVTGFRPLSTVWKSGAASPAFNSGPINVRGFPFRVVAPALSITPPFSFLYVNLVLYQLGEAVNVADRELTRVLAADIRGGVPFDTLHGGDGGNGS